VDEHIALLECFRNAFPGLYIIHNKIILHLPPTEKEFLATYKSIWTKHSVSSVWGGIMVVCGEDGNTQPFAVSHFTPAVTNSSLLVLCLYAFTAFFGILTLSCCIYSKKTPCHSILAHDVSDCDSLLLRHVRSTTSVLVCRLYLTELFPLIQTTRLFASV
jgi:hypothetical protein